MEMDRPCIAHGPSAKSAHCANMGTRRKEKQGASEGNMEENGRGREEEDGVCHLGKCG